MCSRYNLTSPPEAVRAYFGYANDEAFPPRYNIAPTEPVLIVRPGHDATRELVLVRWGLIPSWVKDPDQFPTLLNARAETAENKPSFRGAMRHRRCLVPADGYYEWLGPRGKKQPYLIKGLTNTPLAFAGLYETWIGADGSEIDTMAILTVASNSTVAAIHDRMPAILAPDCFDPWLDTRSVLAREAAAYLRPPPEDLLHFHPVSTKLSNPRNKGPEVMLPPTS